MIKWILFVLQIISGASLGILFFLSSLFERIKFIYTIHMDPRVTYFTINIIIFLIFFFALKLKAFALSYFLVTLAAFLVSWYFIANFGGL